MDLQITILLVSTLVRYLIAVPTFWAYYKNKNKASLYFTIFFLMFGTQTLLRSFYLTTGDALLYFGHLLTLTIGAAVMLYAIGELGAQWTRKYRAAALLAVTGLLFSYIATFVMGYETAETSILMAAAILGTSGAPLIIAAYYFNLWGGALPRTGKNILVAGLALEGLLQFSVPWIAAVMGQQVIAFALGIVFTVLIGVGWWLCLHPKDAYAKNKKTRV